jgi:wobble nucleotide-excising tRNase
MALSKDDLQAIADLIKAELQPINKRLSNLELTLENETNKNIQLLAENHIELVNKLNEAIPAINKNTAYEVKVNYLAGEMEKLKKEVAELKGKIA